MASSAQPGLDFSMIPAMQPPPGVTSNFTTPVTLGSLIVGISATTCALVVLLLGIRLYSTLKITRSASYDDVASVLAFVFALGYVALVVNTKGKARHSWDLPLSDFTPSFFKIILAESFVAAIGFWLSKLSILFLLFRLFKPARFFRYEVYAGITVATLTMMTTLIVAPVLCAPRTGESFSSLSVVLRCAHEDILAVVQGALSMVLDYYIFYIPIPAVRKLHLDRKRKVGVMAIFMTGAIACVASTTGLVYKIKLLQNNDTLWNSGKVDVLNIVELNVAIMVACMPACTSFFRYVFNKSKLVDSLRSKLISSRRSQSKSLEPDSAGEKVPSTPEIPSTPGRYWQARNPFWAGRNDTPPQITVNKTSSQFIHARDLEGLNNKASWAATKTKRDSLEGDRFQSEGKDRHPVAPWDVV